MPAIVKTGLAGVTWTGWDGSVWNLLNPASGAFLAPGVRGFGMPDVLHYVREYPGVSGSTLTGVRTRPREVFWPLVIAHLDGSSQDYVLRDRAFWSTLQPGRYGTWTVTHPDGQQRSLRLRYESGGDMSVTLDPTLNGYFPYGINLIADQPFWEGIPVGRTWTAATPTDFFNNGAAPPFNISDPFAFGSATIGNLGDVDAYPRWTLRGPFTSGYVGVSSGSTQSAIEVPFPVAADQVLSIDTDPREQTAILSSLGVEYDRTGSLGAASFAPVPPGEQSKLYLELNGQGSVSLTLIPKYLRAW